MYLLVVVAVILCILFKVLNVNNSPERSIFYCENKTFLDQILKHAPSLNEPYFPTRLWGFSGHIQTILQGFISRLHCHCTLVFGRRFSYKAIDGATVTYDVYQPIEKSESGEDVTLAICPGICNSSESIYIRRVVYHAQFQGFRVAVLNHVGALKNVPVTCPRIFNYGNTSDFHGMMTDLSKRYPATKFVCIGFSMGGNLITKYLGEEKRTKKILAGISVCQGYDANEGTKYLLMWEGFRRLYLFVMTENMRAIIRRWQKQLFTDQIKHDYDINDRQVWSAATLVELDEAYTRKLLGFESVSEMYRKMSCINYWDGIDKPMVFINAVNDPIVPPQLLEKVKEATKKHPNFLYIEQKYGGHLGFYEGGLIYPNPLTWLDRTVVDLSQALVAYTGSAKSDLLLEQPSNNCQSTDDEIDVISDEEAPLYSQDFSDQAISSDDDQVLRHRCQAQDKSPAKHHQVIHRLPRTLHSKAIATEASNRRPAEKRLVITATIRKDVIPTSQR